MKKAKAIAILSYCDTAAKKEMLRSLIARAKQLYPDRAVLVYSHWGGLESEYYDQADYYIFDKSNPIPEAKMLNDWVYIPCLGKKFYRTGLDYGLAVIQMIKRSSLFLLNAQIDKCLFLNYDIDLDSADRIPMLEIEGFLTDRHVGMFSVWGTAQDEFNMCSFWMNIKDMGREFFESITEEKYLSYGISYIGERIFCSILRESFGDRLLMLKDPLLAKFSLASRRLPDYSGDLKKLLNTAVATRCGDTGEKFLAAWDCSERISSISVEIGGTALELPNECASEICYMAKLPQETKEIKFLAVNSTALQTQYAMEGLSDEYWKRNSHH